MSSHREHYIFYRGCVEIDVRGMNTGQFLSHPQGKGSSA